MKTFFLLVLALLGSLAFVTATLKEADEEVEASPELDWLTASDEEALVEDVSPDVKISSFSSDEEANQDGEEEEEEEDELLESSPFFFEEEEEENDAEKDARDRELRGYYGAGVVGVRGARFYGRTGVRGVGLRGVGVRGNGVTGYRRGGVVAARGYNGRGFVVARGGRGGVVAVGRNGYYNGGVRGFNNNRYYVNRGGVRGFNNNRYYVNRGGVRGFNRGGGVYYVNGGGVRGFNRGGIYNTHGGGVFATGGNVCNFIGEFCTATYQCCGGNCVLNQCI